MSTATIRQHYFSRYTTWVGILRGAYLAIDKRRFYNGEFDPGSGWTLAAGLIHASRGAA